MASEFRIAARGLGADEAARLSQALRETPNILGYRPEELQKLPDCLVAETVAGGETAGIFLAKRLAPGWTDMAVLYVFTAPGNRSAAVFSPLMTGMAI